MTATKSSTKSTRRNAQAAFKVADLIAKVETRRTEVLASIKERYGKYVEWDQAAQERVWVDRCHALMEETVQALDAKGEREQAGEDSEEARAETLAAHVTTLEEALRKMPRRPTDEAARERDHYEYECRRAEAYFARPLEVLKAIDDPEHTLTVSELMRLNIHDAAFGDRMW